MDYTLLNKNPSNLKAFQWRPKQMKNILNQNAPAYHSLRRAHWMGQFRHSRDVIKTVIFIVSALH